MSCDQIHNTVSISAYFICEVNKVKQQQPSSRHSQRFAVATYWRYEWLLEEILGIPLLDIEHLPHTPKLIIRMNLAVSC